MSKGIDLEALGDSPRIVVVVRDHMSGVLYSVPSLRALRRRWPNAVITLVTSSYSAPILGDDCPYIDRVLPLYTFADEPKRFDRYRDLLLKVKTFLSLVGRVDLVVHLRDVGGDTLIFSALLGLPKQIANCQGLNNGPGRYDKLLSINVGPQQVERGSRERNQAIIEALGVEPAGDHLELWIAEKDRQWARSWLAAHNHDPATHLTVVHPGSHWGCNRWLPERWVETIGKVLEERGGMVAITGVARELSLATEIAAGFDDRVVVAAGETSLAQFAALIEASDLVLAIDAAPTQICQALDVPAVIMMGAGNPAWNGPVPSEPMVMLQEWDNDDPRPELCEWANGACNGPLCTSRLEDITVTQVLDSIDDLVGAGKS